MRLSDALKDKLMDVRLRDKWLAEGKITKKELDEYLKSLPDDGNKMTYTGDKSGQASQGGMTPQ